MSTMAGLSSNSRLPWLWIIEYVASFKQVETSIVHDLVEMSPESPELLAKNTREMVALRCLEDLFSYDSGEKNDVKEKYGFALSESCEDVLQRILQEASVSDLKMSGPELLKWDVLPFIKHKRASMPKCALEHLQDTILEGTNPLAASLKESSGLMHVNESSNTHTNDVDHSALAVRVDGSGTDAQTTEANENLTSPTAENRNELSGDNLHNTNLLPAKRDRNESIFLAAEKIAGCLNEIRGEFEHHSIAKMVKQGAICNEQAVTNISVSLHGKGTLEDLPEQVVGVSEGEGCMISNQSQDVGMEDNHVLEDGYDEFVCSKRLRKNGNVNDCDGQNGDVNNDEIQHNKEAGHNADIMSLEISSDEPVQNVTKDEVNIAEPRTSINEPSLGTQRKDSVHKSKGQIEHLCEEEMSSDNDEYHNERIDVTKKKSHFLSSLCSLDDDYLAATYWTEHYLCVKCNKDGQLLACNTSSCPLVVHENCLGSPVKFDEKGSFYCPFCAYSLAISEYLEAKKKASLARKELAAFIHMDLVQHPKECAERLHRKDHGHSRRSGDDEIHENGRMGEQEHDQVNQNGQHLCDVDDHLCQEIIVNKQQTELSASCVNDHLPCREEVANVVGGADCVPDAERVRKEKLDKDCASARGIEGQQDRGQANPRSGGDDQTNRKANVTPMDHGKAEGEIEKEDSLEARGVKGRQDQEQANSRSDGDDQTNREADVAPMDHGKAEGEIEKEDSLEASGSPREKPVFVLNVDGEETSEEENDKFIISNYSIRFRKREKQYTYPAIPQLRRKKVPWTAEEEAILKKGIRKFTSVHDKNIQWKKILEYGSSVFLKGRTTIDLKDKWRNMCKGSPRS